MIDEHLSTYCSSIHGSAQCSSCRCKDNWQIMQNLPTFMRRTMELEGKCLDPSECEGAHKNFISLNGSVLDLKSLATTEIRPSYEVETMDLIERARSHYSVMKFLPVGSLS